MSIADDNAELVAWLARLKACKPAIDWVRSLPNAGLNGAWAQCHRSDWMFWLAPHLNIPHRTLVLIACDCARRVLHFVPEGELRPLRAIEAAEAWAAEPTEARRKEAVAAWAKAVGWAAAAAAAKAAAAAAKAAAAAAAAEAARWAAVAAGWAAVAAEAESKAQADIVRARTAGLVIGKAP